MSLILRMAWRETRAMTGRYLFFVLSVAVGVAAVVGVKGFAANLDAALQREARHLLAADLQVSQIRPATPEQLAELDAWQAEGIAYSAVTELTTMAGAPGSAGSASLVDLKAVDPNTYPLYGVLETAPAGRLPDLLAGHSALVAPDLLPRLGVEVGDTLILGKLRFRIAGLLQKEPDRIGAGFSLGPRVMIAQAALAETGLVVPGSRARFAYLVKVPAGTPLEPVKDRLAGIFSAETARIRDYTESQPRLQRFLVRLTRFLSLASVVALLVGGLGVAHTTRVFLQQKLDTVAVLKCLGAPSRTVTAIYVSQALLLGLAGSLLGAGLGVAAQAALPHLLGPLLELDLAIRPDPAAVFQGTAAGLLVATLFAAVPLSGIGRIPTLRIFRREMEESGGAGQRIQREELTAAALALFGLAGIAAWLGESLLWAAYFLGGLAGVSLLLGLAGWLAIRGLRRLPRLRSLPVRHGIGGLHRPGSQAVSVILALGVGVTAVAAIYLLQSSLLQQVVAAQPGGSPNMVFIGIQPSQRDAFVQFLDTHPAVVEVAEVTPLVTSRLVTVGGRGPAELNLTEQDQQFFNRQFTLTWSAGLPKGDEVIAGQWWTEAEYGAEPLISVEEEAARRLGMQVGSVVEFEIDGQPVRARVHNLRRADWTSFGTNFFVVFSPGVLENFSASYAALALTQPGQDSLLLRDLVQQFPGITGLNLREILETVQGVLDRVGLAIRFVAGFAIAAGLVILAGSVAATKCRRMKEAAVLRALGASSRVVAGILATEYLVLGIIAGAVGALLAHVLAGVALRYLFEASPLVSRTVLFGAPFATAALTLLVGWLASLDVLNQRPLAVLRNE